MKKVRLTALMMAIVFVAAVVVRVSGRAGESAETVSSERPVAQSADITLIIDAGHGGADGGAVSPRGALESEINLDIALRLEKLMAFCGVPTVLTRDSETISYSDNATTIRAKKVEDTKNRVNLINSIPNAVVISIHQNTYPDAGPFGSQVLYAGTEGSAEMAERMQRALIAALTPENRRSASKIPSGVYLMNNIKCPAILIECGFLSNMREEALLQTGSYRLKIASAIASGYLQQISGL